VSRWTRRKIFHSLTFKYLQVLFLLYYSSAACNISAGLESVGLADVQLLVKLMSLLAAGKIATGSLVTSVPNREISSALPDPIISESSMFVWMPYGFLLQRYQCCIEISLLWCQVYLSTLIKVYSSAI
jgi:hypothetical protein